MGQTVYIDLFFMINFSMDFLCFFLATQLLGSKMSVLRTLFAAAVGGIYANVSLFLPFAGISAILLDIAVCALMCLIAFGKCRSLILHTAVYIAISMTLGGFMTALFELLNRMELPLDEIEGDGISAWMLLLLALVSAALTLFGGRFFRRKSARRYTSVSIRIGRKEKTLRAFCDSGNLLRDPMNGRLCVIADVEAMKDILPPQLFEIAKRKSIEDIASVDTALAKRIKLIPSRTAVGDGMLIAIKAEKISIGDGKDAREVDALVALCDIGRAGDGCQALVPAELLV